MFVGLGIGLLGGVAMLLVTDRGGPMDGAVFWGVFTAVLIFSSGRTAIGLLKRDLRQARGGSQGTQGTP
jgi:hypothetical protein